MFADALVQRLYDAKIDASFEAPNGGLYDIVNIVDRLGAGDAFTAGLIFALMDDRDRAYFGNDDSSDQVGIIDNMRAVFGRSYADEPDRLIEQLKKARH